MISWICTRLAIYSSKDWHPYWHPPLVFKPNNYHCFGYRVLKLVTSSTEMCGLHDLTATTIRPCKVLRSWWSGLRWVKSQSMVLRKGKVHDGFRFCIAGTAIPSVPHGRASKKSWQFFFDSSLRDAASIQATSLELDGWLKAVAHSELLGKFKAWLYQHGILLTILGPLQVCEVPITTVKIMEWMFSTHLREWRRLLGILSVTSALHCTGRATKWTSCL